MGAARETRDTRLLIDRAVAALEDDGVPIARLLVLFPTLHPQVGALNLVWQGHDRPVREVQLQWSSSDSDEFKRSPVRLLLAGSHEIIRRRLCDPQCPSDFGIVGELKADGFTDYLIVGARSITGPLATAISVATHAPGGFSDDQLATLLGALPYLQLLLDTHTMARIAGTLLNTYLGHDAGARVLAGAVRRGDGEGIKAAVCFTDLRDFTALSDRLPRAALLELLNAYFDCVVGAVHAHGGEVLKFVGDAVLAVFRAGDTEERAAGLAALAAAKDAFARATAQNIERTGREPIAFGMSIHVGEVTYGNIGGHDRLDFTVIGPAVNVASRVQGLCRPLGEPLVVSEAFVRATGAACDDLGEHVLKGLSLPTRVFRPR